MPVDASAIVSIGTAFQTAVGGILSDLKRQEIAKIDIELLELKRKDLLHRYETFQRETLFAAEKEKLRVDGDLRARGLFNSSIRDGEHEAINQAAISQRAMADHEYHHALAEISLQERRIKELSKSWWMRLKQRLFGK
jgi:hypothetical protein